MYAISWLFADGTSGARSYPGLREAESAYREFIRDCVVLVIMTAYGRVLYQYFGGEIQD